MKAEKKEKINMDKWLNPKTKIRKVYKIEEDGSKTQARVIDYGNKAVFHNEDGPAVINKEQKKKEYYLNGIQFDYENWNEIMKGKEGLPWYKNPSMKGTTRHYYMKIGFCGTMSVGKTTLVNALKELPEFKDYHFRTERSEHLRDLGIPLNTDSTLKGQLVFASERAAELMQENIITDRTIIDVMAFADLSKSMNKAEKDHLNGVLWHLIREYDIIFHIDDLSVPIEDNGVRETNKDYRLEVHNKISSILRMFGGMAGKVIKISGTTEERVEQVKNALA